MPLLTELRAILIAEFYQHAAPPELDVKFFKLACKHSLLAEPNIIPLDLFQLGLQIIAIQSALIVARLIDRLERIIRPGVRAKLERHIAQLVETEYS